MKAAAKQKTPQQKFEAIDRRLKRGTLELRVCRVCTGLFYFQTSQLKHYPGSGQFCSLECRTEGVSKNCVRCGQGFRSYQKHHKFCAECRHLSYELLDPIERKAWSLGANVLGGKGKRARMAEMIRAALGSGCPYCGAILTLENISLDHKDPIGDNALRRNKAESVEIRKHLDRWENLQLVCRKCNGLKGKIPHDKFLRLLEFLRTDPDLERLVLARLAQQAILYRTRRGAR